MMVLMFVYIFPTQPFSNELCLLLAKVVLNKATILYLFSGDQQVDNFKLSRNCVKLSLNLCNFFLYDYFLTVQTNLKHNSNKRMVAQINQILKKEENSSTMVPWGQTHSRCLCVVCHAVSRVKAYTYTLQCPNYQYMM